jgi:hypothetical protein
MARQSLGTIRAEFMGFAYRKICCDAAEKTQKSSTGQLLCTIVIPAND